MGWFPLTRAQAACLVRPFVYICLWYSSWCFIYSRLLLLTFICVYCCLLLAPPKLCVSFFIFRPAISLESINICKFFFLMLCPHVLVVIILPELFLAMPSISSREMDTLVTPMGPCDVSIFCNFFIASIFKHILILTMHFILKHILILTMHSISFLCTLYLNLGGRPSASGGPSGAGHLPCLRTGGCGRNRHTVGGGHRGGDPLRPRHHLPGGGGLLPSYLGEVLHHGVPSWQVYSFSTEVNLRILLSIFTIFLLYQVHGLAPEWDAGGSPRLLGEGAGYQAGLRHLQLVRTPGTPG